MPFQHVAEQIYFRPWLITPSGHASVKQLFESRLAKDAISGAFDSKCRNTPTIQANEDGSFFSVQRKPAILDANGIGLVDIKGPVGFDLSRAEKFLGFTDTKDVAAEISTLVSQGAKGLLLTIGSCGGMVNGTPELAALISEAAETIPVYVFTDSQLCSAAYWLASGATKIVCTESAQVGSIGVYLPLIDRSGQWEMEGIAADPVINTQGTLKAIGFGPSLSNEHRAELQRQVDRIFSLFHDSVLDGRALNDVLVSEQAMQGQSFLGVDAIEQGLVDYLGSYQDAYEALLMEIEIDPEQTVGEEGQPSQDSSESTQPEQEQQPSPAQSTEAT